MNCQEAPTASTSTAACQHVKLRLIWRIDASSQALSKLCFNDTLSEGCFSAWKQRIEKKFQCLEGSLALRYCPGSVHELEDAASLPLESEKDFYELKELYQSTFKLHSKASTYRVVVFAFSRPVAKAPLASCYGVQTRSATVESCTVAVAGVSTACDVQKTDTRPTSGSDAAAEDVIPLHGHQVRQTNTKSCRNPLSNGAMQQQKKLKVYRKHTDVTSTSVPTTTIVEHEGVSLSPAQPDFCWEHILRSIVKTVDRHHFGSKLAALASAAS